MLYATFFVQHFSWNFLCGNLLVIPSQNLTFRVSTYNSPWQDWEITLLGIWCVRSQVPYASNSKHHVRYINTLLLFIYKHSSLMIFLFNLFLFLFLCTRKIYSHDCGFCVINMLECCNGRSLIGFNMVLNKYFTLFFPFCVILMLIFLIFMMQNNIPDYKK